MSATSIMIWVVVPVINVVGGAVPRWIRCAAFWIAIADTSTMPVTTACQASPSVKGPKWTASAAPKTSSSSLIVSMVRKIGNPIEGSEKLNIRVTSTTAQKTGSASSFCKGARCPVHQRRAEGDEVSGHVGGEQSLQCQKPGGIDEAGVYAHQNRKRWFHDAGLPFKRRVISFLGWIISYHPY